MVNGISKLGRIIKPETGGFSPELATYVLSLGFSTEEHAKYQALASKAQDGSLSESEKAELDEFLAAEAFLIILQSKARVSLKNPPSAA